MKGFVIVSKGLEDIAKLEIKELIGATATPAEGYCDFDLKDEKELCVLAYRGQSFDRVLLFLSRFKLSSGFENVKDIDFSHYLKDKTFRVSSAKVGCELPSEEINSSVGKYIEGKVDLSNPDVIVFAYVVNDECLIGIDFSGIEQQKRSYKLFGHTSSLRGTIAYGLVRLSGYKSNESLIDPFCKSGVIPIEAALYALDYPINYYNKEKMAFAKLVNHKFKDSIKDKKLSIYGYASEWLDLNNSKKNAKIAGVNKYINFSKVDIEWVEIKFEDDSVDKMVTRLPEAGKASNPKQIEKAYREFLHMAEFVLKGKAVVCSRNLSMFKAIVKEFKFKILEEREIWAGKDELDVMIFSRSISKD
ncbi:MAG: hypothetical protein KJ601_02840 [Nanoarchaeota archaeon]|nr:hypothetical protein [Nanoarchaeota archaeon]MBU1703750.1 hypothetical protein [Nanoarchaeota archaeon]